MSLSLVVLVIVFLGIALRQLFAIPLKIWQIMGMGALIVLLTRSISLATAYESIDWNIILFLFGMFYLGQAFEESGYIDYIVSRWFSDCSDTQLAALIVFGMGLGSAVLMNDTLAIVGTPLLLTVSRYRGLCPSLLLLVLAFSITIGSVLSPIGNPQNLFIAVDVPIQHPFVTYLKYLGIPTFVNLCIIFLFALYLIRKREKVIINNLEIAKYNQMLMRNCRVAVVMVVLMIGYNIISGVLKIPAIDLPVIALLPAGFLMVLGPKRKRILKELDWYTLIFFAAMFVLMKSVWDTSSIQEVLSSSSTLAHSIPGIITMGTLVSQLISNVPLVALYLPILKQLAVGIKEYMALVAGSTIAGNFLIFGAASNLIIIQSAEKRGERGLSFFVFAKYGIPLTIVGGYVYYVCLTYIS